MTSLTVNQLAIRVINEESKVEMVKELLAKYSEESSRCIIFCETKMDADELFKRGKVHPNAGLLHGDIPQATRTNTYKSFKNGNIRCIIATNVAARGLDIPCVDLIIQCDPPKDTDSFIHRAGRTGRAGKKGTCITMFNKKNEYFLKRIE